LLDIFHPVFLEERFEFFLERHVAMMLGLVLDVFRRIIIFGNANAECTLTFLPLEILLIFECIVNPFG